MTKPVPSSAAARGRDRQSAPSGEDAPAPTTSQQQQQDEGSDSERIDQLIEQLGANVGGGFTAYIERLARPGVAQDLAGYLGPMEFTPSFLDDVAGTYGGGKYRARIANARGKYRASFTFTVAGAPRRLDVGSSAAASGGAPSAGSDSHSRLERMIEGLTASIAGVVELVKQQNQPKGHSLGEVIEIAKVLKELTPATPPATSTKEMLETIETVMDIRERMGETLPRGRGDFVDAVEHGVKPLVSLGERYLGIQERAMELRAQGKLPPARSARTAAGAAAPPAQSESAAPSATPATPAAVPSSGSVDLVAELARAIPGGARRFLAAHAAADRDTETYAIMSLDTIQASAPETYETLPALLDLPDFTDRFIAHVPEWAPHRAWFARMFEDMKVQLAEGVDVAEDVTEGADVGDQQGDRAA